jgi:hypothetical protein
MDVFTAPLDVSSYQAEVGARVDQRRPEQHFNRLAFALAAARLLDPSQTRIAVFRSNLLQVRQGRDLARGPHARWVMLGIPPDSSAESIVLALTQIDRLDTQPFARESALLAARALVEAN